MSVTKTVVARIHCCRDGGDERAGGRATAAATFMYDGLAIMLLGQQLWLKELESYITYPPMQDAETYDLGQVLPGVKKMHEAHPGD